MFIVKIPIEKFFVKIFIFEKIKLFEIFSKMCTLKIF